MGYDKIIDNTGKEIHIDPELHPGEVLADELAARSITKSAFAIKIGMYPSQLSDIIKAKRNVTAYVAVKLESELKIPAEFWLGLQMDFDLYQERNKLKQTA